MSSNSWNQTLLSAAVAGPTLTAAAAASMLVAATPAANQQQFTLPAGILKLGDILRFRAAGIISCAVTTPGTARYDVRFGGTVIFDTGAINLNVVAKASVPWDLDVWLTVRQIGRTNQLLFWGQGKWSSEAGVGAPLPSAGGNAVFNVPVSGLALSTGVDSGIANLIDSFFTQTVATGSMTCQMAELAYPT